MSRISVGMKVTAIKREDGKIEVAFALRQLAQNIAGGPNLR